MVKLAIYPLNFSFQKLRVYVQHHIYQSFILFHSNTLTIQIFRGNFVKILQEFLCFHYNFENFRVSLILENVQCSAKSAYQPCTSVLKPGARSVTRNVTRVAKDCVGVLLRTEDCCGLLLTAGNGISSRFMIQKYKNIYS